MAKEYTRRTALATLSIGSMFPLTGCMSLTNDSEIPREALQIVDLVVTEDPIFIESPLEECTKWYEQKLITSIEESQIIDSEHIEQNPMLLGNLLGDINYQKEFFTAFSIRLPHSKEITTIQHELIGETIIETYDIRTVEKWARDNSVNNQSQVKANKYPIQTMFVVYDKSIIGTPSALEIEFEFTTS